MTLIMYKLKLADKFSRIKYPFGDEGLQGMTVGSRALWIKREI